MRCIYVELKKKRGNWQITYHLVDDDDDDDDDDDALNWFSTRLAWTFQTVKLHVILKMMTVWVYFKG